MNNDIIQDAVLEDPRPYAEQEIDHTHEQMYGGLPVVWTEKPRSTWKLLSQRNQSISFSCLMQSAATCVEKFIKKPISAALYKLRADPTQGGMYLQNVGDLWYNIGCNFESEVPSQNMSDPEMDAIILPIPNIKITGYRTITDYRNIEKIAEAVQAYGQCIVVFNSNREEWQLTPVYLGTEPTFGHGIAAAVDYTLIKGVKTLICMDSAGQGSSPTGVREITQDFLSNRCKGALYFLGATVTPPPVPVEAPTPSQEPPFLSNLHYGMSSPEVARLQKVLRKLGYFTYPTDTGYFGGLTRSAVLAFQMKNDIVHFGIESFYGFFFGAKSRQVLNIAIGA